MQSRNRDTDTENKRMDIKEIKGRWDESGDWDWHEYTIDFFVVVVQSLSRVWLFMTPWTTAHQASLSFTISRSLLKFMSIELVILSIYYSLVYSKFDPWVGKIPWRRKWLPAPVFLPGEFHGQRSLESYSPWGRKESDMTDWLTLSLS